MGDLERALGHVGRAFEVQPAGTEALSVLEAIASLGPADPVQLVPLRPGVPLGVALMRAQLLARSSRFDEALRLILGLAGAFADVPGLEWVEGWLDPAEVRRAIDPEVLGRGLEAYLAGAEPGEERSARRARVLALLRRVRDEQPQAPLLAYLHATIARNVGALEEARGVAEAQHAHAPSYLSGVALAGVNRELRRWPEAAQALRDALRFDPEDCEAQVDLGDALLEGRELDAARAAYREALAREPEHPRARTAAWFLDYLLEGDAAALGRLKAQSHAGDARAQRLYLTARPYEVGLHVPEGEFSELLAEGAFPEQVEAGGLPAPSARMTLDWVRSRAGLGPSRISVAGPVGLPDARVPLAPVPHLLWRYAGTEPGPALPRNADPRVDEVLARLTRRYLSPRRWAEEAALAREQLELGPEALVGLLGSMVHPPEAPGGRPSGSQVFLRQVAAALTISVLDTGWEGSTRAAGLRSLLLGPCDWTTTAGILAATWLLDREPEHLEPILALLTELADAGGSSPLYRGCVDVPLVHALVRVEALRERAPQLHAHLERKQLEQLRDRFR
ncbi:MAG: hypothetical protein R3F62_20840 [Planctomycetota bacterium]